MLHHPLVVVTRTDATDEFYDQALHGIENKQTCKGAVSALQLLEERPAHVVIAEADLDDMSGLDVSEAIRDVDSERDHFTFVILVGEQASGEAQAAFATHVDAFAQHGDAAGLRSMVMAGLRIASRMNQLTADNAVLRKEQGMLRQGQLLDPLTGLGNRKFAEQSLDNVARQAESRGGAVCFVMIALANYRQVIDDYDERIAGELMVAVAERLQNLVRPMDIVTSFAPGEFALVLLQPTLEQCTAECYQRIFDGVALKSYRTAVGFLPANIGMSICASGGETGAPQPQTLITRAQSHLGEALVKQTIVVEHLGTN